MIVPVAETYETASETNVNLMVTTETPKRI
jgi:hypothetical protein